MLRVWPCLSCWSLEREGTYLVQVTELVLLLLRRIPAVLSNFGLISYFFMSIFLGCIDCAVMRGCVLQENRARHSWIYCTLSLSFEVLVLCTCSCKCKNMCHKFHKISRNGSISSAGFVVPGQGFLRNWWAEVIKFSFSLFGTVMLCLPFHFPFLPHISAKKYLCSCLCFTCL